MKPDLSKRHDCRSARETSRPFRVRVHQRTARDRECMNRIRKAGRQERFESANHESKKSKQFQRFMVSWVPHFLLIFSCVPAFLINSSSAADVVIGSKKFTESYVLGEIAKRTLTDAGIPAEHRQGMGGTIILWEALRGGQIDAYPEYEAVFLFRSSTRADTIAALRRLEGTLDETRMIRLNAEAERTKNYARAANLFFEGSRSSVIAFGETFFHKL